MTNSADPNQLASSDTNANRMLFSLYVVISGPCVGVGGLEGAYAVFPVCCYFWFLCLGVRGI